MCDRTDRTGTYSITYSERSGDCGTITEMLVRLYPEAGVGEECSLTAPDAWSENDCKLERSLVCFDPDTGYSVQSVAVTTQQDEAGELITGTYAITVYDEFGNVGCVSSYDITAARL